MAGDFSGLVTWIDCRRRFACARHLARPHKQLGFEFSGREFAHPAILLESCKSIGEWSAWNSFHVTGWSAGKSAGNGFAVALNVLDCVAGNVPDVTVSDGVSPVDGIAIPE